MTGEEMERAIEFLLKNQAAFDARQADFNARMDRLGASQAETSQQIRELTAGQQQTREFLDEITQIVAQNSRDIAQNSRDIAQSAQQLNHINEVLLNVVEGQSRNTEDISVLIKLVGCLIEGKNGKSES